MTRHKFERGDLAELPSGVRLLVYHQDRFCRDRTPCYTMVHDMDCCEEQQIDGVPEEGMTLVRAAPRVVVER